MAALKSRDKGAFAIQLRPSFPPAGELAAAYRQKGGGRDCVSRCQQPFPTPSTSSNYISTPALGSRPGGAERRSSVRYAVPLRLETLLLNMDGVCWSGPVILLIFTLRNAARIKKKRAPCTFLG